MKLAIGTGNAGGVPSRSTACGGSIEARGATGSVLGAAAGPNSLELSVIAVSSAGRAGFFTAAGPTIFAPATLTAGFAPGANFTFVAAGAFAAVITLALALPPARGRAVAALRVFPPAPGLLPPLPGVRDFVALAMNDHANVSRPPLSNGTD
ncbi:MAG TPA: hypothetical protein VHK47_22375 [Polyangia bacterium]|nr:hypothetical protein [Polyangia bacterium]